jgi:hypothetical protein
MDRDRSFSAWEAVGITSPKYPPNRLAIQFSYMPFTCPDIHVYIVAILLIVFEIEKYNDKTLFLPQQKYCYPFSGLDMFKVPAPFFPFSSGR